jgi:hypothetical protein
MLAVPCAHAWSAVRDARASRNAVARAPRRAVAVARRRPAHTVAASLPSAPPPPPHEPRAPPAAVLTACLLASALVSAAAAAPATAAGPGDRRHTRESSIRAKLVAEGKVAPRGVDYKAGRLTIDASGLKTSAEGALADGGAAAAAAARSLTSGVSRKLKSARAALSRPPSVVRGRSSSAFPAGERMVMTRSVQGTPMVQVVTVRPTPLRTTANATAGWALLAAAVLGLVLALRPGSRRAADAAGQWVRDRSLGGRLVRVTTKDPRGASDSNAHWKRTGARATAAGSSPLDSEEEAAAAAKRAAAAAAPGSDEEEDDAAVPAPAWWSEQAPVFVGAARRAAGATEARAAFARLNAARVGGRDYDPADFVALRVGCADAGAPLEASPNGITARESLFRGAVEASLAAAAGGAAPLAGLAPGALLTGLAADLSIRRRRAATLVGAATAARLRGGLLDCLAQLRRGEDLPTMLELAALGAMLRALPMAPSSPELELVAGGLAPRSTVTEREQLMALCSTATGDDAAVLRTVREALGLAV